MQYYLGQGQERTATLHSASHTAQRRPSVSQVCPEIGTPWPEKVALGRWWVEVTRHPPPAEPQCSRRWPSGPGADQWSFYSDNTITGTWAFASSRSNLSGPCVHHNTKLNAWQMIFTRPLIYLFSSVPRLFYPETHVAAYNDIFDC